MMNARAKQLGLQQSHFVNPDGLPEPPGQMMSALDLAKLSRHLITEYAQYYHYFSEREFVWNKIRQPNRDLVLGMLEGADGLKTGHTDAAGYGIVVIDPVYDAFRPRDNADATWVFDGLSPFVRILKHAGILSMMIAHPSSVSRSFGAKGGPTLEQAFSPFGSEKQISVIDALFGIDRLPGENTIRVIKFKSRRAGSWVQNRAEFKLTFGKEGGYSAFSFSGEPWPYENPKRVTIPAAALRLLARLPVDTQFWLDPSKDGKPIRHKDFRENFTLYYEPLDLLRPVENGRRKEYQWTDLGRQAREDGLKLRAKERREAKAKGDAK
jgi:hypothetical protein